MIVESQCSVRKCKHYRGLRDFGDGGGVEDAGLRFICDAFPDGIPYAIAYGDNPHTKPFPGDNGIQFEEGEPEE